MAVLCQFCSGLEREAEFEAGLYDRPSKVDVVKTNKQKFTNNFLKHTVQHKITLVNINVMKRKLKHHSTSINKNALAKIIMGVMNKITSRP
jgi:hypothetical protein